MDEIPCILIFSVIKKIKKTGSTTVLAGMADGPRPLDTTTGVVQLILDLGVKTTNSPRR